ncbi:PaaI family thioesterase [Paenibacillus sp. A14]|uniref:PaaI family thioesterase n=1 Tax=Paenibacillus sp. A14 TaxID=3119820 RepID=UPI002FE336FF
MKANTEERHPEWEAWSQSAKGTLWDLLGCELEAADDRKVVVTLEIQPHHLNMIGILHGGVHAAMMDSAMGLLAMILKPGASVVTTNLNLNYVAKAESGQGPVTVTAEAIHVSRKSVTAQASLHTRDGDLCAFGTGTFRIT